MNAIECRDLTKVYDGFTLDRISFALPAGTILGLVGENGAGKSTTLALLMNAISRDGGEVSILGTDNRSRDFVRTKEEVGVVLDEACFPEVLTARELGRVFAKLYTRWDPACYDGYLARFGLDPDKRFKDLSRGTRMKLALAAALSHDAKLLLLDEATSGLDPMVRDEILDVLNDFTRDETRSVVLSSHIVSDLEKVCDYIDMSLDRPIRTADLAALVGYTEYYLTEKFKKETGQSVSQYIRAAKIARAKVLLTSTALSVRDIAERLAFNTPNYFIQSFRALEGLTPAQYRKQNR